MTKERWHTMSLAQQMGNTGSAVVRALRLAGKTDSEAMEKLKEALELFDLTIDDKRWHGRLREIFLIRSVLCDYFFNLGNFNVSKKNIENYFIPFAIKANQEHVATRFKK